MKRTLQVYDSEFKKYYYFEIHNEFGQQYTSLMYVSNEKEMKLYIDAFHAEKITVCIDGKYIDF